MNKETLSQQNSFSARLEKQFDAFSQKHPTVIKNAANIGGAITLVTSAVVGGAIWEKGSIQEVLADNDRQPICHSGNEIKWTIIRPDEHSYKAHLENMGGPGHNHDYFAYDKDGDGDIDKDDCGFVAPTPTEVFTSVPTLTPELTATFMPSPTIVYTPTEKEPTPVKSQVPTKESVCPPEEDCYCEEVLAGTIAASNIDAANINATAQIEAANINATAQVEAANIVASAQAKSESTPTPNALTSNQPESLATDQDNKSQLNNKVIAGVGAAVIIGGLGVVEAKRRKKKF